MKTIKRVDMPRCDFCHKSEKIMFDVPTIYGSWANVCWADRKKYAGRLADTIGFRLVLSTD